MAQRRQTVFPRVGFAAAIMVMTRRGVTRFHINHFLELT
jgi:hypothetical protein